MPSDQLISIFESSPPGLTSEQAEERLLFHGPNQIREHVHVKGILLFLNQLKSPLILILIAAAFISLLLYQWLDSVIILAIVLGSALIGYYQEFNAQEAIEKLKLRIALQSSVKRAGSVTVVLSSHIVPGDIVLLSAGSMVPADGRILHARDLYVNESAMTGESFPVEKRPGTVEPKMKASSSSSSYDAK